VDSFSERELVRTLRIAGENCTTITVAHKLSSIAHCDKILVLDGGVVAECGSHGELMKKRDFYGNPGLYRRMWDAQHSSDHEN
jgi:ABC-type multidrug transport system fused ATPase/permease subunit